MALAVSNRSLSYGSTHRPSMHWSLASYFLQFAFDTHILTAPISLRFKSLGLNDRILFDQKKITPEPAVRWGNALNLSQYIIMFPRDVFVYFKLSRIVRSHRTRQANIHCNNFSTLSHSGTGTYRPVERRDALPKTSVCLRSSQTHSHSLHVKNNVRAIKFNVINCPFRFRTLCFSPTCTTLRFKIRTKTPTSLRTFFLRVTPHHLPTNTLACTTHHLHKELPPSQCHLISISRALP